MGLTRKLAFVALIVSLAACRSEAAKLKIGDDAPDWKGIVGVDGKNHSLGDYRGAKLVVLVFTCNHCPVAKAYEDRLVALDKDYKGKGVQVVAVNVNNLPADRLDKMKERAEQKGFGFPYIYDSTQVIGRDYGAAVTPHVFVLDQQRKIAYMGAIDDSQKVDAGKTHSLREALDALLAGRQPPQAETKAFGCSIKYE